MKNLALCSLALGLAAAPLHAQEVLRGVSAFATGTTFSKPFEAFVDRVNEQGAGVVQIEYLGGPEAVPTFELGNAVSAGIVDIANNTTAFYPNLLPAGDALHLATNTVQEQRENGCFDKIDALHQEQMNAKFLARTGDHIQFHIYLTEDVEGPDLSGRTIRTTPVYRAMLERLGATPVRTAPGEVYTALERGAIDGYGWPVQGVMDLGWNEQTSYRIDPGFYQVDVNFLVNLDRWNGLSEEARAVLEEAALWIEEKNAENLEINEREKERQAESGIQVIEFTGETAENYLSMAQDAGWGVVEAIDPEVAADLKPCLTQ
ncbi:TRAP transporter substrate-binding protein DctP [Tranquillimonas alkanivorans]|uniref:TRAP-type C4-dicarboxylate transport system, substrate-binding protein n=1 Tax=Tranquillimonas alkanivorans TaxID=441119 RepID=A0A1I5UN58_9RHOB|nr:TRAP transporter substrate-binding protein DctP [Tranquillimonas alkanivorans]SFP96675.1 TRAP-type C4-dicarboxylate transport system, substrate-binding protein [Tranquillimonas alkanivorans]